VKFPYYTGKRQNRQSQGPVKLPMSRWARLDNPANYLPDSSLVDAVNVALLLGQPLLLTGEPGTGKTQLAANIAWELGFDPPLKFETKSTSTARDLFYTYDALGHFHAAQTGEGSRNSLDYITYDALGIAILRANPEERVAKWLPKDFVHGGCRQSVVLIDEVDKAPRDFPNDLLNEIEGMYFKVPELGNVRIPKEMAEAAEEDTLRPILIITSNSEKHLPDAFLRRCVYYNIPFPDTERLAQIVTARLGHFAGNSSQLLADALNLFAKLREQNSGLRKKPATAELLGWLIVLREINQEVGDPIREKPGLIATSLSTLVKTTEDQQLARSILEEWLEENKLK
jgi:MoxR-like ATPase